MAEFREARVELGRGELKSDHRPLSRMSRVLAPAFLSCRCVNTTHCPVFPVALFGCVQHEHKEKEVVFWFLCVRGTGQLVPCRKAVPTPRLLLSVAESHRYTAACRRDQCKAKPCREFDSHLNLFIFKVPRALIEGGFQLCPGISRLHGLQLVYCNLKDK